MSVLRPPHGESRHVINVLANAFLERIAQQRGEEVRRLTNEAIEILMAYDWPGNVRELENALEHAAILAQGNELDPTVLPARVLEPKASPLVGERPPGNPTLDVVEQAYIRWVLDTEGGNKSRAAEVLGIDPSTLYRKLSRYDAGSG
jgi:DNA-binding NtrC family response regulator